MDTSDRPSGRGRGRSGYRGRGRGQGTFNSGSTHNSFAGRGSGSTRGRGGRFGGRSYSRGGAAHSLPQDVVELLQLGKKQGGHQVAITCLAWDTDSGKLYSGSKDGTVCVWDCQTGQVEKKVQQGGVVESILIEGGHLFVGTHKKENGVPVGEIKTYNMTSGAMAALAGHEGEIYALHVANERLFSGGRGGNLHVWAFDITSQQFILQAKIGAANGGHIDSIKCITSAGAFLYSGDFQGKIKVWDLTSGTCTQTVNAHDSCVSQLMMWGEYLVSSSYDGCVRVWSLEEQPIPGAVLKELPVYTHPDDSPRDSRTKADRMYQVMDMAGQLDAQGNPVLITSHNEEGVAHLWDLPSFNDRGVLPRVNSSRAISAGPNGVMFTGGYDGLIRVFQFQCQ